MPLRQVLDLLLGAGGPAFSAAGRQWLAALAENGISLYEVREVVPDEGVRVVDLLAGKESLVWVVERTASRAGQMGSGRRQAG